MYRYSLTVPLVLNDGTPTDPQHLDGVDRVLVRLFPGFTRTDAVGGWQGERLYLEPVRVYHVDTDDPDAESLLRSYAAFVAEALAQECVYLTRQEITTWLVTPKDPQEVAA